MTEGGPDHFALASHKMRESESDRSFTVEFHGVMDEPTNPGMYIVLFFDPRQPTGNGVPSRAPTLRRSARHNADVVL